MIERSFFIDGPLFGMRDKPSSPLSAWKLVLKQKAAEAGFPMKLKKTSTFGLQLDIYWMSKANRDADNVLKTVLDAIWRGDRRILNVVINTTEHHGIEFMRVTLKSRQ